ncbi:hypothetical protein MPSEU_001103900 [Mayamaea pseudoterrestris]|nr:hypothetical protein MPSEU_001103900 [Mayamaea pseudoterrestris]
MHPLLAALLVAVDREDGAEANLRIGATSAISELITSGAPDCLAIYKEFLPVIVDRIQKLLKLSPLTSEDREEMESSISQYCGIVQMLFQRLSPEDVGALADTCMEGVMEILNRSIAACLEDAFLVIAGVASCLDERFNKYLSHIIPHVIQGLRSFQAQELCIISVGVVVDICTAVGPAIQPYCDQIVEALKTTLADSHVPRDVKPVVISCFGDIALAITGAYEPYVEVSAMLLMQASRQCMTSSDDDDMLSFINDLRLAILEAYSGIVIGLADGNKLHLFMASVQSIFQFLEYLSTPESDKDDRVLAKAVALVGDIVQQLQSNYKDSIKAAVNQAWLGNLLMEASVSSDEARQNAIWTRSICEEVMRS